MEWLATKHNIIFIGQGVGCDGTRMYDSLKEIDQSKRTELPVCEELQLGMSIGLSLEGFCPVSIFPRFNFLILAASQLVNHLDRIPLYSDYRPRVIIRTAVGHNRPLDPGPQHQDDFTEAFRLMLRTVEVVKLTATEQVVPAYQRAYESGGSALIVEDFRC